MDAITLLTADHNQVRGLFARFQAAAERSDRPQLQALAAAIFRELDVHTAIEEAVFYPAIRGASDELDDLVKEGLEEHAVAKRLMAEARELDADDSHWEPKLKVLIESVEHHAEEEEQEIFPKLRSAAVDLDDLGSRLEAEKRRLGAPTVAETIDLTKRELEQAAREQQIPGRSSMKKEELAAAVRPR